MRPRRHSLRARIVLTIIGSVIATSVIFGLAAFGIAYTTEDRLFRNVLAEEVTRQKSSWQRSGELAVPDNPGVTIHSGKEGLPPDIRREFAENPNQTEFYGLEGRHYHIQRFDLNEGREGAGPALAVAVFEVSRDLLVRPVRASLIALLVGTGLFVAVVMAVCGWWLANRAMKPLSALARDVANTDTAIPTLDAKNYPANEIGMLAEALEQAFSRTRGFVDRERTFTRDASHELRTPLAVVRGAVEVIRFNRRHPPHFAEPLRRIEMATADMALALDQLLALARENEGVLTERVALRPMIDKAAAWAEVRYPGAAITVSINVDADAAVVVHPTSLQLVLNNLIGNCFQHVGTGRLAIDFEGGHLSISDDGPGFGTGDNAFAPFAKGYASTGSGLGLDISRRLCEAARIGLTVGGSKVVRGAHFRLEFYEP
jgi:signal transduction histidine kinase